MAFVIFCTFPMRICESIVHAAFFQHSFAIRAKIRANNMSLLTKSFGLLLKKESRAHHKKAWSDTNFGKKDKSKL